MPVWNLIAFVTPWLLLLHLKQSSPSILVRFLICCVFVALLSNSDFIAITNESLLINVFALIFYTIVDTPEANQLFNLAKDFSESGALDETDNQSGENIPCKGILFMLSCTNTSNSSDFIVRRYQIQQGYSIGGPRSGSGPRRNQIWTEAKIKILI